ncbi:hypothetical protein LZD49_10060 [Dyadobacter sp. CY261]|uniref:hypothetical protein n=1 Tax=Dyadobacter sp. CY261 TaxID=2907203 RepID=UPI001F2F7686|nr:hypothetical protein [Dyadobacter sp. CY261]MCF0070816.1 hypothetical protein [Dyadobacter sp. CY261]
MDITVSRATSVEDQRDARYLLKTVYKDEFGINFDEFKSVFPLDFNTILLVIRNEENQLLGTASIMEPVGKLFPTEYIFGANVQKFEQVLPLAGAVEIGRLAKSKDAKAGIVTKAIMLATMDYLTMSNFQGWVSTVKSPLYRLLRSMGLEMFTFDEFAQKEGVEAEIVARYKGDHIESFFASTQDTVTAFRKIERSGPGYQINILL